MATPEHPPSRLPIPSPRISRIPQPTRQGVSPIPGRAIRDAQKPVTPARSVRSVLVLGETRNAGDLDSGRLGKEGAPLPSPRRRPATTPSRLRPGSSSSSTPLRASPAPRPTAGPSVEIASSPRSDATAVHTPRPSIREQIAARRKALLEASQSSSHPSRENPTRSAHPPPADPFARHMTLPTPSLDADIFGRTIPRLIRKAMTTGRLDVANMALCRLPPELWTRILGLTGDDLPPDLEEERPIVSATNDQGADAIPPHEAQRISRQADEEIMSVPFYQVEDLCVIRASGNEIRVLEPHVGLVGALRVLDVHSNELRALPDSLINLRELTTVDVSDNQLTTFPPCLILAPSLTHLHLARNALTTLSWSHPVHPNPSLLQTRLENSFFDTFPSTPTKSAFRDADDDAVMPSLKVLDLAGNRLTNAGLPREWPRGVEVVDVSNNALAGCVDLTALATLTKLRRLVLRGNAITGVRVNEGEGLWPVLECVDLQGNELVAEEEVVRALRIGRQWTTGDAREGAVQIKLDGNPIVRKVAKTPHPATLVVRSTAEPPGIPTTEQPVLEQPLMDPVSDNVEASGPFVRCWNAQEQSIVVARDRPTSYLDGQGILDLAYVAAAVPASSSLRTIEVSGVLQLKCLRIPRAAQFGNVTTLAITNTSLRIDDGTLGHLAQAMPRLETLDLSGSRIEHVHGVQNLCANGLKRLLVKGCRIADISALVHVATQLHEGRWRAPLQLEQVDIRDNEVAKLEAVLGCLPLRSFLVENNAFRVPHRRVWEREGTAGLLRWLREGL